MHVRIILTAWVPDNVPLEPADYQVKIHHRHDAYYDMHTPEIQSIEVAG